MGVAKQLVEYVYNGGSVSQGLEEIFDRTVVGMGSLLTTSQFASPNPHDYRPRIHDYPEPVEPNRMSPAEFEMLQLLQELFAMLQRAHLKANDSLAPLGIRYEVKDRVAFPDLRRLTTSIPTLVSVTIELRDLHRPRRLPQLVKYRFGVGISSHKISLRVLDHKLNVTPPRHVFKPDRQTIQYQVRGYEDMLVPKLIERARRAYRR